MRLIFEKSALIPQASFNNLKNQLVPYIELLKSVAKTKDYGREESSINLPFDQSIASDALALNKKINNNNLKYIINIGIGGSNLGTKAVYDAIYGHFDAVEPNRFPKMIFADTIDSEFLNKLLKLLNENIKNPNEILINIISKSGSTTETVTNFEIIYFRLSKKFGDIDRRIVVITDSQSNLWNLAKTKNIEILTLPKKVGGRFSIFSSVGIFPLVAAGINVNLLIDGAKIMIGKCLSENAGKNPALTSAIILYLSLIDGKTINDNFLFHPELESLGKWYRQLMGESLGKEYDVNGKQVNAGITPTASIGSTDLHSVGQLYLGGPKDKITTFISSKKCADVKIPNKLFLQGLVSIIAGKTTDKIMKAILEGVKIAYTKKGLPFMETVLDDLSGKSLGEFMQFKMIEMMFLSKLMNVNAFDQPNVEDYKVETKRILTS